MFSVCIPNQLSYGRMLVRWGHTSSPRLICSKLTTVRKSHRCAEVPYQIHSDIFRAHRVKGEIDAEEAAESLYDLVEKAPSYWQDLNDPVEHALTT
jgi:hypothetical protein